MRKSWTDCGCWWNSKKNYESLIGKLKYGFPDPSARRTHDTWHVSDDKWCVSDNTGHMRGILLLNQCFNQHKLGNLGFSIYIFLICFIIGKIIKTYFFYCLYPHSFLLDLAPFCMPSLTINSLPKCPIYIRKV